MTCRSGRALRYRAWDPERNRESYVAFAWAPPRRCNSPGCRSSLGPISKTVYRRRFGGIATRNSWSSESVHVTLPAARSAAQAETSDRSVTTTHGLLARLQPVGVDLAPRLCGVMRRCRSLPIVKGECGGPDLDHRNRTRRTRAARVLRPRALPQVEPATRRLLRIRSAQTDGFGTLS